MNLLVTGCAGFIGSCVARQLLAEGHTVVGIDNLNTAYDPALKEWRLKDLASRDRFTYHRADITDADAIERVFAAGPRFDAVFNLAARAGVRQSVEEPDAFLATNAGGAITMLEACRRHDVPKFLLASTSSLYGARNNVPFSESASTDRPLSPYAATKKAAESMAAAYRHLYGLDTPVLRYFTVYGPAGRPDMSVFRFVRWIVEGEPITVYGDGTQKRDFTYVEDIARGTIAALKLKGFDIVNLGNDAPAELSELIRLIEKHAGANARIVTKPAHAADVKATWADVRKAKRLLGWTPRTSLDEGVARCVAWYREHREWASKLDLGAV
ncbi:MAG: SDR family NAD(P)-dependent oxidoreductase [Methanobacteriota archaeon]